MRHSLRFGHVVLGAAFALVAAGCVKDTTTAPTGTTKLAGAVVGYSNPATKLTTCGNCHVLKQASWIQTGHSNAWKDLQASGHASAACNQCHTTSAYSFGGADSAGFFAATASNQNYFQDVQCEACHGAGQAHVTTPDETQPVAYLVSRDTTKGVGCGMCHSGPPHNPFYEDWSRGAHSVIEAPAISNTSGTCLQCHEGKTAAMRFGASNVYVESGTTTAMQLGCTTCHDPHGSPNTHEVRASITVADTTNLCIQCHKRRSIPDLTSASGPHSPQGPTFLGTSGWRPAGFTWDSTSVTTHSNPSSNPQLCATCHVATLDVNNAKGQLAWHYTGHSFYAIPCVDTAGIDSTNSCDVSVRSFAACATSGCHASEAAARTVFQSTSNELQFLAGLIWTDVNGNGKIDSADTGLLTKVAATEFKTRSATVNNTLPYTVAEGGRFNVQLIANDRSHGAHNAPYLRSLLVATIQALKTQYGLAAPAADEARVASIAARLGVRIAATR
ncbi:MAG TPA: cytochrome c3 family protein [Gemmatimonadales bacterium]|nr:cytochrome c3 family protein [Gemmatimonadales bacterium]